MPDSLNVLAIELEIDPLNDSDRQRMQPGVIWRSENAVEPILVAIVESEAGHGFGLSEVITIAVSFATGISSDLVAEAIRSGVGKVIHRSKAGSSRSDGSHDGLTKLVERERPKEVPNEPEEKQEQDPTTS